MKAWGTLAIVLTFCVVSSCSDRTSPTSDAAPDVAPHDVASDVAQGGQLRGFVGVAQTYADQKNGPRVDAYQAFVREDQCGPGSTTMGWCTVTAVPNECGGMTFSGSGELGRVFARDLVAFSWPYEGGRLPYSSFSAGEVRMEGQTNTLMLPPKQPKASNAIVAFDPLETIRVSAMGADAPAFATDIQMPSRVVFSMPDLAGPQLVMRNDPIEVAWTADADFGTVEVWSAFAFTPDARSEMELVHCSAPLGATRLTVPPLPRTRDDGLVTTVTRALAVRVQRAQVLHVDGWAIQVTAASFDSGALPVVASVKDAAPSTHIDDAMPELR